MGWWEKKNLMLRKVQERCRDAVRSEAGGKRGAWKKAAVGSGGDETGCQEVKPRDRNRDEGMDGRGLGIACEKSRGGGEERENICSVYLLRSKTHDHNPPAVPKAFFLCLPLFFSLPPSHCFPLYLLLCFLSSLCPPTFPSSVISEHGEDGTHSHA